MPDSPSESGVVGRSLGQYRLIAKLGAGGMGEVYRAHDDRLDRDVAVKVLPTGGTADDAARKRFRKEALALSKLNHPNIATIFDFNTLDGLDFLVMELVEGEALSSRIGGRALAEKDAASLGRQIAEALEEAHDHGVVHRDLKPANIVVTPKNQAKVLDFGLAKLVHAPVPGDLTASVTATPAAAGTLPYMAPEQLQGEEASARSDIYSLGAVLYEMATGQRPFHDALPTRLVNAILHEPPVAPRLRNERASPELERIILKCLDKDPGGRYQSARELAVDLRRLVQPSSITATAAPESPGATARSLRAPRLMKFAVFAAVLLAGLALGINLGGLGPRLFSPGNHAPIESLAVLPLENLSHDPDQDYFSDGMTEELTANLAQIGALRVISRTSVMQYKEHHDKTMPEIGRELHVDALIEGSVLRAGQRVRITAQLIRASNDQHLWAKSYDGDLSDVLTLQSTVAREIAGEIKAALTPHDRARLASTRKVNPQAHEAYLLGRHFWDMADEEDLKKSLEYYKQALALDPDNALVYAGIADTYTSLSDFYLPPREVMPQAAAAAKRALELDDSLAEAHEAMAWIHFYFDWDWPASEREFKRALELKPNFADAHHLYANFLASMRRRDEARTEIERAEQLAPFSLQVVADSAWVGLMNREYQHAIERGRAAVAVDPSSAYPHMMLALVYARTRQFPEAIAEGEAGRKLDQSPLLYGFLGTVYAEAGRRADALKVLDSLKTNLSRQWVCPYEIGTISLLLGNKDEAFTWYGKAIEARSACMPFFWADPRLDSIHSDPRYQELVERLKFPVSSLTAK